MTTKRANCSRQILQISLIKGRFLDLLILAKSTGTSLIQEVGRGAGQVPQYIS